MPSPPGPKSESFCFSQLTQQLYSDRNEREENQEQGQPHVPQLILQLALMERRGEALNHPFPYSGLRAALLKRGVEEALTFKGLLKLGKTSNKEISCHMMVVGKTGIQSYNFAL